LSRESKVLIGVLVVVVASMIGLFAIANRDTSGPAPKGESKVVRDSSHKQGTGPVQLVEFGDYQCPACGSAHPNLVRLMQEYQDKVTFYFRNYPILTLHKNANVAAYAAEAAADQGKFWEMHDKLYETQKDWESDADPTDKFVGFAKDLGLDTDKFKKSVVDEQFKSIVDQDVADANVLGVSSTPTFYLNGTELTGGYSYENLKSKVDAALGAAPAAATPTPAATVSPAAQ
jgi:protein-disulfide isomerase